MTHIFKSGDPHLDDDAVFAVKESLIVDFAEHGPGIAPNGERMSVAYSTAKVAVGSTICLERLSSTLIWMR